MELNSQARSKSVVGQFGLVSADFAEPSAVAPDAGINSKYRITARTRNRNHPNLSLAFGATALGSAKAANDEIRTGSRSDRPNARRPYLCDFALASVKVESLAGRYGSRFCIALFPVLVITILGLNASAQQPARGPQKALPRATASSPVKPSTTSPNDPQQLLIAGQTAQEQGRFDEAIRTFNRVVALSANQPKVAAAANLKIGNVYMAQGKFANAQVAYERAISLNPGDAESYNNLGEALGELRQYKQALEQFNRAVSLDAKLIKAKYNQAVSYDRMGNFRYSEFVFRSLIKANPNYSLAYDGLAVTLSKAGRAKEAIAFHEKAISLDPIEPSYYFNCAISYLMMKNTAKALEIREKLKTISPAIADRLASVIIKHQM